MDLENNFTIKINPFYRYKHITTILTIIISKLFTFEYSLLKNKIPKIHKNYK